MKFIRAFIAALALVAASLVGFTATAPTAFAYPSNCQRSGNWSTAGTYAGWICFAGTGHYGLYAKCTVYGWDSVTVYTYPQVTIGQWAWVNCPSGYHFKSGGLPTVLENP